MYDSIIQSYENIDSSKIKQQQTGVLSEQSPLKQHSFSKQQIQQLQALHNRNCIGEQNDDQKRQHSRSTRYWKHLHYFVEYCQNKKWFKMNSINNILNQQHENQSINIENDDEDHRTTSTLQQQEQEEEMNQSINNYNNNNSYWKQEQQYSWIYVLISGQILAFGLACGSAAQAALVSQCHVSAPAFSIGLVYLCLSILILPLLYYETHSSRRRIRQQQQQQQQQQEQNQHHPLSSDEIDTDIPSSTSFAVVTTDSQHEDRNIYRREATHETETDPEELDSEQRNNNNKQYTFLFGQINLVAPAYVYLLLSILDFYANYLTVLAFKYTTLTSVTLLDATAIPTAMILSKLFLKRQYTYIHLFGVTLCIIGVFINVQHDYEDDIDKSHISSTNVTTNNITTFTTTTTNIQNENIVYPYKFKGDMFAFIGGALFGCVNVFGEIAVRNYGGPNEYIGMIGFFGTFVCIVHGLLFDHTIFTGFHYIHDTSTTNYSNNDNNVTSTEETIMNDIDTCTPFTQYMYLLLFVSAATAIYIGGSRFLQYAEAAFLNLSFLTADFWSVIFSIFTLKIIPQPLFFLALLLTIAGVIVYETVPTTSIIVSSSSDDKRQYQQHQPEWTIV